MLTVEKLRTSGADVDDGLKRCMNMEAFYLDLVQRAIADDQLVQLEQALLAGDLDKGFEIAHALKGVYANLSLTPLFVPVSEITELLCSRTVTDYAPLLQTAKEKLAEIRSLAE